MSQIRVRIKHTVWVRCRTTRTRMSGLVNHTTDTRQIQGRMLSSFATTAMSVMALMYPWKKGIQLG